MKNLAKRFKEKIKKEGRKYSWFLKTYIPDMNYSTFLYQINEYSSLSEELEEAIERYLNE